MYGTWLFVKRKRYATQVPNEVKEASHRLNNEVQKLRGARSSDVLNCLATQMRRQGERGERGDKGDRGDRGDRGDKGDRG